MTDADKLAERLPDDLRAVIRHYDIRPGKDRQVIETAADYIASHQRRVEAAARKAVEECVRLSIEFGYEGRSLRELLDSPDFWNTINAAAVQDDSVVNGTNAEREPTAPSVPPAPAAAPINEPDPLTIEGMIAAHRKRQPSAAPPAPSLEMPEYPALFHLEGGTMVSFTAPANNKPSTGWIQSADYDALRSTLKAALERIILMENSELAKLVEAERRAAEAEKERDEIKSALSPA